MCPVSELSQCREVVQLLYQPVLTFDSPRQVRYCSKVTPLSLWNPSCAGMLPVTLTKLFTILFANLRQALKLLRRVRAPECHQTINAADRCERKGTFSEPTYT